METKSLFVLVGAIVMIKSRQLKTARTLLGMTQEQFAEAAGVSEQTIRRWEAMPGEIEATNRNMRKVLNMIDNHGVLLIDGGAVFKQPRSIP